MSYISNRHLSSIAFLLIRSHTLLSTTFTPKVKMAAYPEDEKTSIERVDDIATMDSKMNDINSAFIEKTDEEKQLVRKIDLFLMPTIWILYCFSYMVRTFALKLYFVLEKSRA